jgi:hypothetical protein
MLLFYSVAHPGCLSQNPDPNFPIPDPHQKMKYLTQKIVSKLSEI